MITDITIAGIDERQISNKLYILFFNGLSTISISNVCINHMANKYITTYELNKAYNKLKIYNVDTVANNTPA
jgi:hypothetical protein